MCKKTSLITGEILVYDENGKLESSYPFNSFVKNYLAWLRFAFGDNASPVRMINGSTVLSVSEMSPNNGSTELSYGLCAGTDSMAEDIDQYKLGSTLTNSNASCSTTGIGPIDADSEQASFKIGRNFTNISGGNISISEIVYFLHFYSAGYSITSTLIVTYDLISPGVVISPASTKKFEIKLSCALPLTLNFANSLRRLFSATDATISIIDIDGVSRTVSYDSDKTMYLNALSTNTNVSIVVGDGDAEAVMDDYILESQITALTHSSTTMHPVSVSGTRASLIIERTFTNSTGSEVMVKEVGIYARLQYSSSNYYSYMIYRKVLEQALKIPNASSETIQIEFYVDYSE